MYIVYSIIEHSYLYDHISDPHKILQQDTDPSERVEQPPDSINHIDIRVRPFSPEKACRVVRAVGGEVFIVKHHTGCDEILLS
jgi:hypothetical protein